MAEKVVDDVEALFTSTDGDTTGNFVISIRTRFYNECGMILSFIDVFALNPIPTGRFESFARLGVGKCPHSLLAYISTNTSARIVIQVCIERNFILF